ncbi:MAG: tetratricopeptide repeat protein [Kiritimatiellia bacterium]|nr:tetratricopeptide repeat protein [Kiritimatiellia bacterium]
MNRHATSFPWNRFWDAVVFLSALLLFGLTLHPGPAPGESAAWMAQTLRLTPFPALTHPLYGFLARALSGIPLGSLSFRLNGWNALCAAACVCWLGRIVRALAPFATLYSERHRERRIAGVVASATLALSFPFWHAATRAGPLPFTLALLLAATDRLLAFEVHKRALSLIAFGLLYGAAVAEHPAALLAGVWLLPVAALILARHVSPVGTLLLPLSLRTGAFLRLCALTVLLMTVGLAAWPAQAIDYRAQPVFAWREMTGIGEVLLAMLRAYVATLRSVAPHVGGLLIGLVLVFPGLYVLTVPHLEPRETRSRSGTATLMLTFSLMTPLALLLDRIAPALALSLLEQRVLPSATLAAAIGALTGWWIITDRHSSHFEFPPLRILRAALRRMVLPLAAILILSMAWMHGRMIASANRQQATTLAQDAIRSLGSRDWLLHNSPFDDLFRVAAAEAGVAVHILHLGQCELAPYRRYVADQMDTPRLRSLISLGAGPFLAEWLRSDASRERTASFGADSLWERLGFSPLPIGPLAITSQTNRPTDPAMFLEENLKIWRHYENPTADPAPWRGVFGWNTAATLHMSRAANNSGVWLESVSRADLAREAYLSALRIYPEHPSALLNLLALDAAEGRDPDATRAQNLSVWKRETDLGSVDGRQIRQLFGDLSQPESDALTDFPWAPQAAFRNPANLARTMDGIQTPETLDTLLLPGERKAEAEALGASRMNRDWLEKARNLFMDGRLEAAPAQELALARLFFEQGWRHEARLLSGRVLRLRSRHLDALDLQLRIETAEGRSDAALALTARILEIEPNHPLANHVLGSLHLHRGEEAEAESAFRLSLEQQRSPAVLNDLAYLLARRKAFEEARSLIEEALQIAPRMGNAWDTFGMILLQTGQLKEAENALDKALSLMPDNPEVLWHKALLAEALGQPEDAWRIVDILQKSFHELPDSLRKDIEDKLKAPRE